MLNLGGSHDSAKPAASAATTKQKHSITVEHNPFQRMGRLFNRLACQSQIQTQICMLHLLEHLLSFTPSHSSTSTTSHTPE
jgi:hypothetical protein